jgi:ligand-binding sensor domain-containing protein
VTKLCKTRKGEIYAGTNSGLFLLDTKEKKFSPVELNVPVSPDKPLNVVTIAEDDDGSLWIGHQMGCRAGCQMALLSIMKFCRNRTELIEFAG